MVATTTGAVALLVQISAVTATDMKRRALCAEAGINSAAVTNMGKNGHVTTEILMKIFTALACQIGDILVFIPDDK